VPVLLPVAPDEAILSWAIYMAVVSALSVIPLGGVIELDQFHNPARRTSMVLASAGDMEDPTRLVPVPLFSVWVAEKGSAPVEPPENAARNADVPVEL